MYVTAETSITRILISFRHLERSLGKKLTPKQQLQVTERIKLAYIQQLDTQIQSSSIASLQTMFPEADFSMLELEEPNLEHLDQF